MEACARMLRRTLWQLLPHLSMLRRLPLGRHSRLIRRSSRRGYRPQGWFAADAERVNKLSFDAGDLHFDLSKNLVTDETVKLLCDLAREVKLEERRDAMFSGEHINTTEDRAVLHTALRRPQPRGASSSSTARMSSPTCTRSSTHVCLRRARALR